MNIVKSALCAVSVAFGASAAQAATYSATDYDNGHVERSIWTQHNTRSPSHQRQLVDGPVDQLWSVQGGRVVINGDMASYTGTALNLDDASIAFDISLSFSRQVGAPLPYCHFGRGNRTCDAIDAANGIDTAAWDYFDLTSGSFTGIGDVLGGVSWDITDLSAHAPQFGVGANGFEADENGFSMWFTATASVDSNWTSTGSGIFERTVNGNTYSINTADGHGRGDFNVRLEAVPLPAAAWMLLSAMGGLVLVRTRREKA